MYERVVLTFARQLQSEVALRGLLEKCTAETSADLRTELAQQVAHSCAVRALAYEHLLSYAEGKAPGPEGSLDKLLWSESFQDIAALALRWEGLSGLTEGSESAHRYLYSRGRTIAAGTSEIQRNIIAERLLGLPRG
jgi:alkylation response protein AidB-like acyl-CoA dehydrogenase